ncbi:protein MAIN-LIKE 1-like [Glycine soja]|uniref:protein MAIN-LIKE 1-like n=1 Tax=Glycine soja TaxID=3848 RepID=UPI0010392D1A|nr:protein MAIN-LIKE 1-like [Glycine soja]
MAEDVAEDVPQLPEDVPQLPEDVPQLAEDVPDASDGSPERTGAIDGAESDRVASDGTTADDEGFPGGPRNPSVLIGFADHVAHSIWRGQERPDLKLVSHGRKVDKFGRPTTATGLDPLFRCSVITTDPRLISAFVERWHRETSSFHLPVGEVTITLDDALSLLHVLITGALHSFGPLATSDAVALLTELLQVTPDEATAETHQAGGPHVRLSWLRDMYQSRCRARQWVAAAPAYLLHLGEAALVHLYDQLNEASQAPTRQMVGYISLLQCWIYKHFPSVHRSVVHDGYAEASRCACRWFTGKAQMTGIKGGPYRARIDALTITDVCWMSYVEHREVRGYDLISSYMGLVRWGPIIVYLRPERVVRQMGYIQIVPPPPVRDSLTGTDIDDRWVQFSDHVVPTGELCVVPGQVAPNYMEWFFQISHPFVTPTEDTAEPRPVSPLPTPDDDFVEPPVAQVPVTSDPPAHSMVDCTACVRMGRIAEQLERVINLRMVTAGTDLYDIMDLCLRIARDDDPDDIFVFVFVKTH